MTLFYGVVEVKKRREKKEEKKYMCSNIWHSLNLTCTLNTTKNLKKLVQKKYKPTLF